MEVVLFHTEKEKLSVLAFCLESQVNVSVTQASSLEQTMTLLLGDADVDLIIANESPQLTVLMKYLLSVGSKIPLIVVGATKAQEQQSLFSEVNVAAQVKDAEIATELPRIIQAKYKDLLAANESKDVYCRINVELLCDVTPLADDVYVRLSSIKYVKLFKAGTVFTEKDLKRLCGVRNIQYLYIPKSASGEFVNRLQDRLHVVSNDFEDGDERLVSTVAQVQETLHDLVLKVGFTPPVMALAKTHVETALKMIGKFPRLHRIFEGSFFRNSNYTSRHSVMVAHLSCAIANKLNWPSDSTFQKLIVAALLHDIALAKPEFCEIKTKTDLEKAKARFSDSEFKSIENHPFTAAEIVSKLHEIPADVYVVVLQHHERPDGTGFPRSLHAPQIAPLAAVFIVAHDLVEAYEAKGAAFDMDAFWKERAELYSSSTFKKIAKCFTDPSVSKAA
jgi:putative nucleotidyltransferase with HDIG domain